MLRDQMQTRLDDLAARADAAPRTMDALLEIAERAGELAGCYRTEARRQNAAGDVCAEALARGQARRAAGLAIWAWDQASNAEQAFGPGTAHLEPEVA